MIINTLSIFNTSDTNILSNALWTLGAKHVTIKVLSKHTVCVYASFKINAHNAILAENYIADDLALLGAVYCEIINTYQY